MSFKIIALFFYLISIRIRILNLAQLFILNKIFTRGTKLLKSFLAAIVFYTVVPLPKNWVLEFGQIARWAPLIGVIIGIFLGIIDWILYQIEIPPLTCSILLVTIWIAITGGLHLDGVIDTADGLAVLDPQRRLEVMKDSVIGAFGAIAAITIILLKSAALSEIQSYRWLILVNCAGWGRFSQVVAIAFYSYLKPTGKGKFHKENFCFPQDILLGLVLLLCLNGILIYFDPNQWLMLMLLSISGFSTAIAVSWWFNKQLGGYTGDVYGSVIEWTEAILLLLSTIFFNW